MERVRALQWTIIDIKQSKPKLYGVILTKT